MHIVHFNTSRGWGGGELQLMHLLEGLRRAGVRSTLLARPESKLFEQASKDDAIELVPFEFKSRHNPLTRRRLRGVLRDLGATVLHLHDGRAASMGLSAARGLSELAVVVHRRVSARVRRNPISQRRYRSKRIDAYIVVSESASRSLRAISVPGERMALISGGVDLKGLRGYEERERVREELGIGDDLMIGTVGALAPKKDVATFVEAAALLSRQYPRAKFVVIGDGEEREALEVQAREAGLGERMIFTGALPHAYRYIGAMDAFVFPSLLEGSPGVVKEAMVLGVPVIAARAPGTDEVVRAGTGVLVPMRDAEALASAVNELFCDDAKRLAMIDEARAWVAERYSMEQMIELTIEFYRKVSKERLARLASS